MTGLLMLLGAVVALIALVWRLVHVAEQHLRETIRTTLDEAWCAETQKAHDQALALFNNTPVIPQQSRRGHR